MPLGMEVGLSPSDINGDPAPPPQKGAESQFSSHICCGQMAGWIKMLLGREVGLSPSDIVLDVDPAPFSQKGAEPPIFDPCLLWLNGWMDQNAPHGTEVDLSLGHIVLDGDPAPPRPRKGHGSPALFGPCLLWRRSPISATAELLLLVNVWSAF